MIDWFTKAALAYNADEWRMARAEVANGLKPTRANAMRRERVKGMVKTGELDSDALDELARIEETTAA